MWKQNEKNILVIGHRGADALYPENTMLSFEKAVEEFGVDGLETDVQMTKDGVLVLMHDLLVDRTTDGHGNLSDFTLEELKQLDAGGWFSDEFAGQKIPVFTDFLEYVKGKNLLLNIEIKDYRREVVDQTVCLLEDMGFHDTYVLTCFQGDVTTYAHETYGVKTQGFPPWKVKNYREDTARHYYSVGISMGDLTRELCRKYRSEGIDPWCYCPNDAAAAKKAAACGVSLVTCDNPLPALEEFRKMGVHK